MNAVSHRISEILQGVVLVLMASMIPAAPSAAQPHLGDDVSVVHVPGFTYELIEVNLDEPADMSVGAGSLPVSRLLKVVVRGENFRQMATGPIVWLNGIPTERTAVLDDGKTAVAYFLRPLSELEEAAAISGAWELIYQPNAEAAEVYRISPTGAPAHAMQRPTITRERIGRGQN